MGQLPPALQGINWSQWQSWTPVTIGSLTYYSPPGQPALLFDPNHGANGTITSRDKVQLEADKTRAQQSVIDQANNPPSPYMQAGLAVAGTGATALGAAAVHNAVTTGSVWGAGSAAAPTVVATPAVAAAAPAATTVAAPVATTALGSAVAPAAPAVIAAPTIVSGGAPGTLAASGATPVATGGTTALGAVGAGAGIAAGLYGGYQTSEYIGGAAAGGKRNTNSAVAGAASGAALGAGVGSIVPGAGTLVGAGIGALVGGAAGLAGSYFGSGKDKYQMARDQGRNYLKGAGLVDDKLNGTLADGSAYNFGHGGNLKDFDYKDPVTGKIIAQANMIAAAEGFVGRNLEAQAGIYAAAALSNAGGNLETAQQNIQHFASQRGMTSGAVNDFLNKQLQDGQLDEDVVKVLQADASTYLPPSPGAPAAPGSSTFSPNIKPIVGTGPLDPGRINPGDWRPGMPTHSIQIINNPKQPVKAPNLKRK